MIDWCATDLARRLASPKARCPRHLAVIGGGFGLKLFVRADAVWRHSAHVRPDGP